MAAPELRADEVALDSAAFNAQELDDPADLKATTGSAALLNRLAEIGVPHALVTSAGRELALARMAAVSGVAAARSAGVRVLGLGAALADRVDAWITAPADIEVSAGVMTGRSLCRVSPGDIPRESVVAGPARP